MKGAAFDRLAEPSTYFRAPIARGIAEGTAPVEVDGGDDKAGIIRGFAVVSRGEAEGHDLWVDGTFLEQTAQAINEAPGGIKARFTHPGLSGDGMGKFLGRVKAGRVEGDVVRADLHFSQTAHQTPDGDLAQYTMALARRDPAAFGTSISFKRDREAEDALRKEKGKRSPDPDNKNNQPHARLESLRAVDAVDDPAANPNGLFHRGDEIAAEADRLLAYSLGLAARPPELVELGIDPERGAGFVQRFLKRHGLEVRTQAGKEFDMEGDKTKAPVTDDREELGSGPAKTGGPPAAPAVNKNEQETGPAVLDTRHDPGMAEALAAAQREGGQAEAARQAGLDELAGTDVDRKLLAKAKKDGWTLEAAAPEFLADVRKQRPQAVSVGREGFDDLKVVLVNTLLAGDGFALPEKDRAAVEQFQGIGLHELARICVGRENQAVPHNVNELFANAISSSTFPEILGDSLTRSLHRGYTEYPGTFAKIADVREVKDFRTYKELKLGEFGRMKQVGPGGEIGHDKLEESKEEYAADTYGKRFSLTRRTWINDDLGAFTRIPRLFGGAAARNIDEIGYELLELNSGVGPTMQEDSKKLFSATHATPNYKTGDPASVLSDTGMTNAKILLRKIQFGDVHLNVVAKFGLFPPELEHTALKLVQSQELMVAKAGDADVSEVFPTKNVHRGTIEPVIEPRLSAMTNGTTAWYLFADPGVVPTVVIVVLRGQRNPVIERHDPVDVLGIGWWCYHDVGVGAVDWRGAIRSKGA